MIGKPIPSTYIGEDADGYKQFVVTCDQEWEELRYFLEHYSDDNKYPARADMSWKPREYPVIVIPDYQYNSKGADWYDFRIITVEPAIRLIEAKIAMLS